MYPRKKLRKVEELKGRGSLVGEDQKVYPVSYWILICQEMFQLMPNDLWTPGLFHVTGRLGALGSFAPSNLHEDYILRLKDGIELEVFITRGSTRSPYCEIAIKASKSFLDRYKSQ
jgi:hypothetical protein